MSKSYSSAEWVGMNKTLAVANFYHPILKYHVPKFAYHGARIVYRGRSVRRKIEGKPEAVCEFTVQGTTFAFSRGNPSLLHAARLADVLRLKLQPYAIRPRKNVQWNFSEEQAQMDASRETEVCKLIDEMLAYLESFQAIVKPDELRIKDTAKLRARRQRATDLKALENRVTERLDKIDRLLLLVTEEVIPTIYDRLGWKRPGTE